MSLVLPSRMAGLFSGLGSILLGTFIGQGFILASSPLLTRLYGPTDFGALTAFTALAAVLSAVATLRLESAITLPRDDAEAAAIAWAALCALAIATIGLSASTAIAGVWLSRTIGAGDTALWWLLPVTVAAIGVSQVLSACMVRERRYRALGVRNAAQGIGQVTAQAAMGLLAVRPLGLLAGIAAGRLVGCGGLAARHGLLRMQKVTRRQILTAIRRYRRFPLIATGSAVLNTAGMHAPLLLIGMVYGQAALGFAGLTARVLAVPASLIGQAVASHYQGEASEVIRNGEPWLHRTLRRTVSRMLLVGLVPAGVLTFLGPTLFTAAFGGTWEMSGEFARLLAVGYLAQFAVSPVSQTLNILQRQGQQLHWDLLRLLAAAAGPLVCAATGASITVAVALLSLTYVAAYLLLYVKCAAAAEAHDTGRDSGIAGFDAGRSGSPSDRPAGAGRP